MLWLVLGAEPPVPSTATLVLHVAGDPGEGVPDDSFSAFLPVDRAPTVRSLVENVRKAKVDGRVRALVVKPVGLGSPYAAKLQETARRHPRFPPLGQARGRLPGRRRAAGVLPGHGVRPHLPDAVEPPAGHGPGDLRAVPARHARQDWRLPRHAARRATTRPRSTSSRRRRSRRPTARWTTSLNKRRVRAAGEGDRERAQEERGRRPRAARRGAVPPEDALRGRPGGRPRVPGPARTRRRRCRWHKRTRGSKSDDYAAVSARSVGLNRGPRIAVIYATGTIVSGRQRLRPDERRRWSAPTRWSEYDRRIRDDHDVKAVVAAGRQPGRLGHRVRRHLAGARADRATRSPAGRSSCRCPTWPRPGGYYIAVAAPHIVAQPGTLTGSIGIFGGKFVTGGTYAKLGANIEASARAATPRWTRPSRPYNAGGAGEAGRAAAGVLRRVRREGGARRGT